MIDVCVGCCWCTELWVCAASTGNGFCQQAKISRWLCCNTSATDCSVYWHQQTPCVVGALGSFVKLTRLFLFLIWINFAYEICLFLGSVLLGIHSLRQFALVSSS